MEIVFSVISVITVIYSHFIFLVTAALGRLKKGDHSTDFSISVIVAARNEEKRITKTLESLEKLDYPQEKYEIIFVDDASEDATASIIDSFTSRHKNWQLLRLDKKDKILKGKKAALKKAIDISTGELIFTTDADCQVPAEWLRIMSSYFKEDTAMVLGHGPLRVGNGFVQGLLDFDNLFSAVTSAAPAKLGFAVSSIGRNLAYRKEVYYSVGGYDALARFRSGDDVHLTELFRMKSGMKIDYCADPRTFVLTDPLHSSREVFHQQMRKNSKTLKKSWPTVLFSIVVFLYHLGFIALPFAMPSMFYAWLLLIAMKVSAEWVALLVAARKFNKRKLIRWILPMQFIYPVYIIAFSILGSLQLYEWKK